jgi:cell cycle checkpoint control protein RAD9A
MVILNFTLSEEGVAVLHDALACMFKFSDDVCLEAKKDKARKHPPLPDAAVSLN